MKSPSDMSDSELEFAWNDIKKTMQNTRYGPEYIQKLWDQRDRLLDEMSKRCVAEYNRRYER